MANQELDKMLKRIDQKIKALETAKRVLIEEFGDKSQTSLPLELVAGPATVKEETAKERIVKLLIEEGPLRRKEIRRKTGMPVGTIAFNLNDKNVFYNLDGKWHLRKGNESEAQEEKE